MKKLHRNAIQPGHELHWYRIREILGQGGFGITYLAHDINLDQDVAIKEYLPIELAVREGDCSVNPLSEDLGDKFHLGLQKFIAEARTLSKFRHPNIVRVRNVFEENNTAYMVMDYEEGETLKDRMTRRGTLDEAELLNLLVPILGGLEQVHQAGYIHRDIKPANLFIRRDGSPVLLDFGSARQAIGEQTRTLTSLVSPGYAPFEQYYSRSDAQGPWTDIYGLGATLYRAVSGRPPMDAVDRSEAILKAHKDTLVPASTIGVGRYSQRFLAAINHALAFNPEDRPQSIAAWHAEFATPENAAPVPVSSEETTVLPTPGIMAAARQLPWAQRRLSRSRSSLHYAAVLALLLCGGFVSNALWREFTAGAVSVQDPGNLNREVNRARTILIIVPAGDGALRSVEDLLHEIGGETGREIRTRGLDERDPSLLARQISG
ncbi:MAG: serine/threonine protein kinase [Gammaproteobacteria bacterium]|nr:serine/threonine protein kinase [Gammaproteobacteria bacterium]